MTIITASLLPNSYKNSLFSLTIKQKASKTNIRMELFTNIFNTIDLPKTFNILEKELPTILSSTCFNDDMLPFFEEVKETELGHLFEHILLEYLCLVQISLGFESAVFNGVTNWDWNRDKKGVFHIQTDTGYGDIYIFTRALLQSMQLLHTIISSSPVSELKKEASIAHY